MVKAWSGTAPAIWYDSAVVGSPAMLPVPLAAAARLGATPPRPWGVPPVSSLTQARDMGRGNSPVDWLNHAKP